MDGRVVGIDRRREARVHHAAVAHFDVDASGQAVIDRQRGIDEAGEQVAAGRAHNGRADVRRAFGLVGTAGEIEKELIAFLLHAHVQTHRLVELDAVAVDEALALTAAVGPRGDFCAHLGFGQRKQLLEGFEYCLLAVALHHFLKASFAQARRADLAAQIADDELRRAAVAAEQCFDVFAGFVSLHVLDRRYMQPFLVNFARLTPATTRHRDRRCRFCAPDWRRSRPIRLDKKSARARPYPARAGCRRDMDDW